MAERLALLLACMPLAAWGAEPPPARQADLLYLLRQDCGSCHGLTLKGGLGPPLLPASLTAQQPEGLAQIILGGVPGTPMPPWAFEIAPDEALWLARRLQSGDIP
ncbi:MAG TPA: cytochrome c [Geminicoccaceae bacterium]|nr:cytochrome c [Geminicoccus sp.]HMU50654.1 cytochrome c [Geminicoccaceae bacterium]